MDRQEKWEKLLKTKEDYQAANRQDNPEQNGVVSQVREMEFLRDGKKIYIKENYPEVEVLMGTSTAGIAHAAIIAQMMELPMGYVRGGNKDHGRQNRIEGKLEAGQKVVVVEDLISTGGSVIDVVDALREAGADVLGIVSIFTYGMQRSVDRLAAADVKNVSLTNLDTLIEAAVEENYIQPGDADRIRKFRDNPSDESWIGGDE